MGVKLRVLCAACGMAEGGDCKVAGFLPAHLAALPNAGCRHVLLDMAKRSFDRCGMRSDQPLVAGNLGHDRDRLGRGEGDVPARPVLDLAITSGAELLPGNTAFEQLGKFHAVYFSGQAQRCGGLSEPLRGRKAALGIVVVSLVVAGCLPGAGQGKDRSHHQTGPASGPSLVPAFGSSSAGAATALTRLHKVLAGSPATKAG